MASRVGVDDPDSALRESEPPALADEKDMDEETCEIAPSDRALDGLSDHAPSVGKAEEVAVKEQQQQEEKPRQSDILQQKGLRRSSKETEVKSKGLRRSSKETEVLTKGLRRSSRETEVLSKGLGRASKLRTRPVEVEGKLRERTVEVPPGQTQKLHTKEMGGLKEERASHGQERHTLVDHSHTADSKMSLLETQSSPLKGQNLQQVQQSPSLPTRRLGENKGKRGLRGENRGETRGLSSWSDHLDSPPEGPHLGGTFTTVVYVDDEEDASYVEEFPNIDVDSDDDTVDNGRPNSIQVDNPDGLAVAQLIQSGRNLELPIARSQEDGNQRPRNKHWAARPGTIMLLLGVFVIVVAGGLAGGILASRSNAHDKSDNDGKGGTDASGMASGPNDNGLLDLLPEYTAKAIQDDPASPQSQAYDWLVKDPALYQYSDWRMIQRFAMATFFFSTGGGEDFWLDTMSWLSYEHHECDWTHQEEAPESAFEDFVNGSWVQVYPRPEAWCSPGEGDQEMRHFWFTATGATGEIPLEFFLLTNLQTVKLLNPANLGSSISSHIGQLTNLEVFTMNNGQLEGTIPTDLGILTGLKILLLATNSLQGELPTELGSLTKLEHFWLEENLLQSTIPSEIGLLTNLQSLYLSKNQFSGRVPTHLGKLTHLVYLFLNQNKLVGRIPSEIGFLTDLRKLVLAGNSFSGTVLDHFTSLTTLENLHLDSNILRGTLPSKLSQLTALENLILNANYFSGSLPSEIGSLASISLLYLFLNDLTGTIPTELAYLTTVNEIALRQNRFTGTIPAELGQLNSMSRLYLDTNLLTGEVPSSFGPLTNLERLRLEKNNLVGTIPDLSRASSLASLRLSENDITGRIPSHLGALIGLEELMLDQNNLSGPLPSELGQCQSLSFLNVSTNLLTGAIPPELGNLVPPIGSISNLDLRNNQFSGTIPEQLCGLYTGLESACTDQLCGCSCVCFVSSSSNRAGNAQGK